MLHGDYNGALDTFDSISLIPGVDVGLLARDDRPARLLRLFRLHGPHLHIPPDAPKTNHLDRLMNECIKRVMKHDNDG